MKVILLTTYDWRIINYLWGLSVLFFASRKDVGKIKEGIHLSQFGTFQVDLQVLWKQIQSIS